MPLQVTHSLETSAELITRALLLLAQARELPEAFDVVVLSRTNRRAIRTALELAREHLEGLETLAPARWEITPKGAEALEQDRGVV